MVTVVIAWSGQSHGLLQAFAEPKIEYFLTPIFEFKSNIRRVVAKIPDLVIRESEYSGTPFVVS